jgi:prevent-host-death family protein
MATIDSQYAKAHFPVLLKRADAGETITITRLGRPVAKLCPRKSTATLGEAEQIVEESRKLREAVAARGGMRGLSVQNLIRQGRRY